MADDKKLATPPAEDGWYVFTPTGEVASGPHADEEDAYVAMTKSENWVGEVIEGTVDESYSEYDTIFALPKGKT